MEETCKFCIINKHPLFYLRQTNQTLHLVYQCSKKTTKIQKGGLVYLSYRPNLDIPIKKSKQLIIEEALENQPRLF